MPFNIALSGLNAATVDLEVTGNNIANSATNGFKESRAEFADLYGRSVQDVGTGAGQGARVASVAQQFHQGSVDFTSNNLDLAVSGQGFFVLKDAEGAVSYTRAGAFRADRDGKVVNHDGQKLQVYPAVTSGTTTVYSTGVLSELTLPSAPNAPSATTEVDAALNLDSSTSAITAAFDSTDPATYTSSTSTTVYDSLGNAHTGTMYFQKTAANTWRGYLYVGGSVVQQGGNDYFSLAFSNAGALTTTMPITMDTEALTNGAADLDIDLDFTGTTQYGTNFAVNNLAQDGYASGRLSGVDIDTEGVVFARYTNGQSSSLGKVAMAKFANNQGLRPLGDTNFSETYASGAAQLGEAATSSFGQIKSGALEASNVDIAEQLVKLITAQRNFQANAEVISTADTLTQTIINIR